MRRQRSSSRMWLLVALPVLAIVAGTAVVVGWTARRAGLERDRYTLAVLAEAVAHAAQQSWPDVEGRTRELIGKLTDARHHVALLGAAGRLRAGALPPGLSVEAVLARNPAHAALLTGRADGRLPDTGGGGALRATAVRVGRDSGEFGLVWVASRERGPFAGLWSHPLLLAGLAGILLAGVLGLRGLLRYRWRRQLLAITNAVRSQSDTALNGDRRALLEEAGSTSPLARAIHQMRQRLIAQVEETDRQRRTFESLLNQIRDGVVVLGPTGEVRLLNPAALSLLGLVPSGGVQTCMGLAFERVIPQLELQRLVRAWYDGGGNPDEAFDTDDGDAAHEKRVQVETEGGVRHLLANVSSITLPGPAQRATPRLPGAAPELHPVAGCVLVLTDITALVRTIQIKSDFVANASHELRTPLSTIRAAVEALQRMDAREDPATARRFIEVIDRQSGRLEELAGDLLDLARLESQAEHFPFRTLSLPDLGRELREHFANAADTKGVRLELEAGPGQFSTSPQLVRLVLDNLIDNAIKFTDPGRRVRVALCRDADGASFTVADEGCGIDPDHQERVFERFYQVERARSGAKRGTGLGLAIVRHAVRTLGGVVTLDSSPRTGTTVVVQLPASAPLYASAEPVPDDRRGPQL